MSKLEPKVRVILIGFVVFVFFYTWGENLSIEDNIGRGTWYIYVAISGWVSWLMAPRLIQEIANIFEFEDDDEYAHLFRSLFNMLGVFFLYLLVQYGVMIILFPDFDKVIVLNTPVYPAIFITNCVFICRIYYSFQSKKG